MIKVHSIEKAWEKADEIFPTDYAKDTFASERAGYDIYRHTTLNPYCKIADLGNRLEVTTGEYGETTTNIWIVDEEEATEDETRSYGQELYERVKEKADFKNLSHFENFVLNNGFYYKTEDVFKAAYDRAWKAYHGILISLEEFKAEVPPIAQETAGEAYEALAALAKAGKIKNGEVYSYAKHGWCLRKPEAIIAYEQAKGWEVNNCETEISEEAARVGVCEEWGFEASRVHIIGTPYYEATDWQFIRFDCAHMTWLWKNGSLYQVYGE